MQKQNISQGGVCPKIESLMEKQNILTKSQSQNVLYLSGYFYFVLWEVKVLISRQSHKPGNKGISISI